MELPAPIEQEQKRRDTQLRGQALVFVAASVLLLAWIVFAVSFCNLIAGDKSGQGLIVLASIGISLIANFICLIGLLVGPLRMAFFLGIVLSPSVLFLCAGLLAN
jgi:hypothetical protein